MTMPELPRRAMEEVNPYLSMGPLDPYHGKAYLQWFSAEQMLSLRAAAFRAGMERAAEIAREHCEDAHEAPFKDYENTHVDGYQDAANDIDEAIRSEIASTNDKAPTPTKGAGAKPLGSGPGEKRSIPSHTPRNVPDRAACTLSP